MKNEPTISEINTNAPVVSIVTATRNRIDRLASALRSIKSQTFEDFEVLVVDDGSDQSTLDAYDDLWKSLDSRFRLLRQSLPSVPGTGPSAARNRGISASRGEFVAFLDDDDSWVIADHLTIAVKSLKAENADYYFGNMAGERLGAVVIPDWYERSPELRRGMRVGSDPPVFHVDLSSMMKAMDHRFVHPNVCVVRRSLLETVGGFLETIKFSEDYELMMRLVDRADKILCRPEVIASYRLPEDDSISLKAAPIENRLQLLSAIQHAKMTVRHAVVQKSARAREAWTLRQLSEDVRNANRRGYRSLAWQSLCIYPTLGACWYLIQTVFGTPKKNKF